MECFFDEVRVGIININCFINGVFGLLFFGGVGCSGNFYLIGSVVFCFMIYLVVFMWQVYG